MVSRTPEGKHTKRFIVERKMSDGSNKWTRSGNSSISGFFETKEAAQEALKTGASEGIQYRVRQK